MEDQDFINQLIAGDQQAFRKLIVRYEQFAFRASYSLLLHDEDAKDTVQEVFIQVFHSISQFKGDCKLSTWIYRIAITKSLDLIKSRTRKKRISKLIHLFSTDSNEPRFEQMHYDHPGIALENKERAGILFAAIAKLPEKQKTAFSLHKIDQQSYQEIAEIMGLSLGSIESLIFRAKENLKKSLGNYYRNIEG